MSMQRVAPSTPVPLRHRVAYRFWNSARRSYGELFFWLMRRGWLTSDWGSNHVLWKLNGFLTNRMAAASWKTSVCVDCGEVTCPPTCIQAISLHRHRTMLTTKHGERPMGRACPVCRDSIWRRLGGSAEHDYQIWICVPCNPDYPRA